MFIAEYTLDHPTFHHTLNTVPELEIIWEDTVRAHGELDRLLAWVECDDFEAFEAAAGEDSTVTNPTLLLEAGPRRLYRIDPIDKGQKLSTLPILIDVGGVVLNAVGTKRGWRVRTRFPNRAALEKLHRFCRENEIKFTLHRVYERSVMYGPTVPQLSEAQHETLVEAVESGYLDIPRKSSLEELGGRLGISESAASERFRRGVKMLIQQTL